MTITKTLKFYIFYYGVHVFVFMWRSEDNFQFGFVYTVASGN